MHILLLCRSLTYAQRSAKILERAGITGMITRMPRMEGIRGCAYGVLIKTKHREHAISALVKAGLPPEGVYIREKDGTVREAEEHDLA